MKVLVIKDEEGVMRPGAGIWPIVSENMTKAIKEEWDINLSKKKNFKGCTLVEAELTEK
jgi:hypothetical protein